MTRPDQYRMVVQYSTAFALAFTGIVGLHTACVPIAPPPGDGDGLVVVSPTAKFDPLSRPEEPTVSIENFRTSTDCAPCHPNQVAQWQNSLHAYATIDPVWRKLVLIRQAEFDGERDQFCTQCHSAIGVRSGEIAPGFSFDNLSPIVLEGVTCEACHKVSSLARVFNSGHVLDETGPMRGPIEDPVENGFHQSEFSPLHDESMFCGGCHDVVEQSNLNLERAFEEWSSSPAAEDGRNCQSCHMPTYTGKASEFPGTPVREGIHDHRFIGGAMPLAEGFISDPVVAEELRVLNRDLLRSAADIEIEVAQSVTAGDQLDLFVTVHNRIDGHSLPTGATFLRQLWIAVTVTDATGAILYQTGHLDDDGDLRNFWSASDPLGDVDLIELGSRFVDERGNPTLFPWLAAEHITNSLSPLFSRTFTLFVPTGVDTVGPISISAQLRYREFPPFLIRAIGLEELVDKLEITDMDETQVTVNVN